MSWQVLGRQARACWSWPAGLPCDRCVFRPDGRDHVTSLTTRTAGLAERASP